MSAAVPVRRLSVLIVDDYADTVESAATLLRIKGHDVRTARTGAEALGLLNGWQPDVAVLDLMMPEMDGFQLAERLCEQSKRQPLLVAVSGSILASHRQKAARVFDRHFLKPIDPCELTDLLTEYAGGAAGRPA
jgi:two-component system, chemotaxis family, CheB/CheR fusion protein